jgi:hypothetical protein
MDSPMALTHGFVRFKLVLELTLYSSRHKDLPSPAINSLLFTYATAADNWRVQVRFGELCGGLAQAPAVCLPRCPEGTG